MATRLRSASSHYGRQRRIAGRAVRVVVGAMRSGNPGAAASAVAVHQQASAQAAVAASAAILVEQGIAAPPVSRVLPAAFTTARPPLLAMLAETDSLTALRRLVSSLVPDAGRAAQQVDTVTRPALQGHVRYLQLPSCSRCVVLAGRIYRWSDGFLRHPGCDCVMLPTNIEPAADLVTDPTEAVESGLVTGLSKSDLRAIAEGADLGQVVNVRRKGAGLTEAGQVLSRAGRPTPAGIFDRAADRDDALALLQRHGYIL